MTKEILGYYWKAIFSDATELVQFDALDVETPFSEVEVRKAELNEFHVISADDSEIFRADLVNKIIYTPTTNYPITGTNPQLIYKRRNSVRMEIGGKGKILDASVIHILGIITSTQEKQLEIFAGQGVKPKKIDWTNVKTKLKSNITTKL